MGSEPEARPIPLEDELARVVDEFRSSWRAGQKLEVEGMLVGRTGPIVETLRRVLTATEAQLRRESSDSTRGEAPAPTSDLSVEPVPGYRRTRRLGGGGFGEVWEARGPGGIAVALKFVHLRAGCGQAELRAFEALKGIRHPNLLSPFGAWQVADRLIIGMELADGTLMDRLTRAENEGLGGIPTDELHEYLAEAAKGIDHLNEPRHGLEGGPPRGVQHRDIKPQNILLVGGGVKVADFGLARLLEGGSTGHSGSLTPSYAAPEFFQGETSHRSDQYSLAVTYCHLVGGRLPFVGPLASVIEGHLHQPPDLTMVPEVERAVVARALAKRPGDRWPSCRAFVAALREAPAVRRARLRRRRWRLATLGALLGLPLATVAGWFAWPANRPDLIKPEARPRAEPEGPLTLPGRVGAATPARPSPVAPSPSPSPIASKPQEPASRSAPEFMAEGDRAFQSGDYQAALVAYSESIEVDSTDPAAWNNRGSAYYKLGHLDAAADEFGQAIRLAPLEARPYFNRGTARYASGRFADAVRDFDEALRLDPGLDQARINRGLAQRERQARSSPAP